VANHFSNTVSILLGNGDGTFSAAASPSTGTFPASVAVGDFNGDGRADLAVANHISDTVSILLGNGDGSFSPAAAPATGNGPESVVVGDFNGDGKADLAVVNGSDNTLSVLLGNGSGTFAAAATTITGTGPVSVAVGDFNGDGKADLSIANSGSNTIGILLGNGDGTFSPAATTNTGNNPQSVVVGDFNGDGRADLALANFSSDDTVSILLGAAPVVVTSPSVGIDAPSANAALSGSVTISGWAIESTAAVGPNAISQVAVIVDGAQVGTAVYGGARPDVCALWPGRLGCPNVGWSYALNTAPLAPGTHILKVVATDTARNTGSAQVSFTSFTAQIITFGTLPDQMFGAPPFSVSASASSGLAVSFNSQTTPVCTVSGTTVTLVSLGTCSIVATQAGNTIYAPATPVIQTFTVTTGTKVSKVGVFRNGTWHLDLSGTPQWAQATDLTGGLGLPGDIPVVGDWNGSGKAKVGVFRNGTWYLDMNGNAQWDGPWIDLVGNFGQTGDIPVVGDWTGSGTTKIGVFRNGTWYLDMNGNGQWDGPGIDLVGNFGQTGDIPVVGDWNGSGKTKVGVFRNGVWHLLNFA
jgi:hypothetical protein